MRAASKHTVMGHDIAPPRPTLTGILLATLPLAIPVLILTGLADLVMQLVFHVCTGWWCWI
ncbi:hypothetical protein [Woodsholea maritima]|uniref:hypothetical protein n=1 Tax=Woodsholea maritima TaxID=240237 RepID=UPI000375D9A0|nr:hypothetical protein [Woodsholea maritima]